MKTKVEKLASTILTLALLSGCTSSFNEAPKNSADQIWHGGSIITMEDSGMRAEAIAERHGKIVAVGSLDEVMKYKGSNTKLHDLTGKTLLPGFVDAHGHMFGGGIQALSANLLAAPDGVVSDIPSLKKALRDWIKANSIAVNKAKLIVGFGYDNASLAEKRHPTRNDLDEISRELPIVVIHQSGHLAAVNSKALELAMIDAHSKNPSGGVIQRFPGTKQPNGVLEETAAFPVILTLLKRTGKEGAKAFARAGATLWARYGYTTADEGRSIPAIANILKEVADEGGFQIDVATYPDVLVDKGFILSNISNTYKNRFRVAGAKLTIDGSPQGFTAWRDRPYHDPVGNYPKGYSGYAAANEEQIQEAVDWAYANDIQLLTHANGEAASDSLINAMKSSQAKYPAKDRRMTLIHGQLLREDQLDSYKKLGTYLSLFPMHTFYWGDWHSEHTVGPQAAQNISPTGWALKRGMIFSSHHDAPVAFPDSMRVLDATVTRRARGSGKIIGSEHCLTVITALKAMTIWPAMQHFEEQQKGSLALGKLADFVILSADPTAIDRDTIDSIKVKETIKEGKSIFKDEESSIAIKTNDTFSKMLQAASSPATSSQTEISMLPSHCPGELLHNIQVAIASGV
jgi:predicted amidohydrolase YtcJ